MERSQWFGLLTKIRGLEFGGRNLWLLPWWWFGISYCCRGVADDGIMEVGVIEKFQLWVHLSGISMIHRVKKGNNKSMVRCSLAPSCPLILWSFSSWMSWECQRPKSAACTFSKFGSRKYSVPEQDVSKLRTKFVSKLSLISLEQSAGTEYQVKHWCMVKALRPKQSLHVRNAALWTVRSAI